MNRKNINDQLLLYLNGILYHDSFFADLLSLLDGAGSEKSFFKTLVTRLLVLNTCGVTAINSKEFERIGELLYSMHFPGKDRNIRILYAFLSDERPVLLCAFFERAGKRRTDYSAHIPVALERLSEMKEEYENG